MTEAALISKVGRLSVPSANNYFYYLIFFVGRAFLTLVSDNGRTKRCDMISEIQQWDSDAAGLSHSCGRTYNEIALLFRGSKTWQDFIGFASGYWKSWCLFQISNRVRHFHARQAQLWSSSLYQRISRTECCTVVTRIVTSALQPRLRMPHAYSPW